MQACRSRGSRFWQISWPYLNHGDRLCLWIFKPSYGPESLSSRLMMLAWYSNFLDPLLRITYYTTELYYQHSSSTNLATATLSFIIFHTVQYKKLSIRWVLLRWLLSMLTIFILQCCLDFYGSVMIKNCSILSSKIPKSWSRVRLSVTLF